ncbi:MAG: hypothetical protein V3W44_04205 [Dehalococcoidales bacterium]
MEETEAQKDKLDGLGLLNANLSKKMGIGMLGMYWISKSTDVTIAIIIGAIAVAGIAAQTFLDFYKIKHGGSS